MEILIKLDKGSGFIMYNNEMSSFFPYHVQCGYHEWHHHSKNDVNFRPRLFLIAWFQFDFFNAKDASKGLADIFDRNISRIFFNKGQN